MMSISNINGAGKINNTPSVRATANNSGPDFMDELKAKFDSALRHLQERNDLPVSGVYSFNNNIYSTINIGNSKTSIVI